MGVESLVSLFGDLVIEDVPRLIGKVGDSNVNGQPENATTIAIVVIVRLPGP